MSWNQEIHTNMLATWSNTIRSAVASLCVLAAANGFAADFDTHDDSRIIITIDSAKYLHLSGKRAVSDKTISSAMYRKFVGHLEQTYELRYIEDWPLPSLGEAMLVFAAETDQATARLAETINRQRVVKTVQAVRRMRVAARVGSGGTKAEPLAAHQDNLDALGLAGSHRWATGQGVRIAIIDTGVDRRHPDLRDRVEKSADFSGGRSRDFDTDVHGTVVASIIAGARNSHGMLGVAPDATLILLKACTQQAPGNESAFCDSITLAKALDYAIEQEVGVINLSLVGPDDPLLTRLVAEAIRRNISIVASAGKSANESFPAGIDGVLAVTGDSKVSVPTGPDNLLHAPGRFVLGAKPGSDYDFFSGNSVAAAQVSGVIALLRQRKPHLAPDVIVRLLQAASHSDTGLVQACDSLARIVGVPCDKARMASR